MNDKVPLERVLDDMYSDNTFISSAARDYYYEEYATDKEREKMDKEDELICKINRLFDILSIIIVILLLIFRFLYS